MGKSRKNVASASAPASSAAAMPACAPTPSTERAMRVSASRAKVNQLDDVKKDLFHSAGDETHKVADNGASNVANKSWRTLLVALVVIMGALSAGMHMTRQIDTPAIPQQNEEAATRRDTDEPPERLPVSSERAPSETVELAPAAADALSDEPEQVPAHVDSSGPTTDAAAEPPLLANQVAGVTDEPESVPTMDVPIMPAEVDDSGLNETATDADTQDVHSPAAATVDNTEDAQEVLDQEVVEETTAEEAFATEATAAQDAPPSQLTRRVRAMVDTVGGRFSATKARVTTISASSAAAVQAVAASACAKLVVLMGGFRTRVGINGARVTAVIGRVTGRIVAVPTSCATRVQAVATSASAKVAALAAAFRAPVVALGGTIGAGANATAARIAAVLSRTATALQATAASAGATLAALAVAFQVTVVALGGTIGAGFEATATRVAAVLSSIATVLQATAASATARLVAFAATLRTAAGALGGAMITGANATTALVAAISASSVAAVRATAASTSAKLLALGAMVQPLVNATVGVGGGRKRRAVAAAVSRQLRLCRERVTGAYRGLSPVQRRLLLMVASAAAGGVLQSVVTPAVAAIVLKGTSPAAMTATHAARSGLPGGMARGIALLASTALGRAALAARAARAVVPSVPTVTLTYVTRTGEVMSRVLIKLGFLRRVLALLP